MKLKDLRNPAALASIKRAGWEYDEELGALVVVVKPVRRRRRVICVVSLEIAELAVFDVLDWEYCRAAGLPEPPACFSRPEA